MSRRRQVTGAARRSGRSLCQAAGFLVADDHAGEYRFSDALVRSAVMAQLSASDQLRWHDAAADAIERFYSGQLRTHLAELACEQALAGPELDAALRARVLARHARALAYRREYERAAGRRLTPPTRTAARPR